MAKLLSYYRLCPLIDTKTLLGISEDSEKGVVLVTLGKNIAIKYRLSDQKQLDSWRSKEKFTSPVCYDKKLEKYVAVFNESFLRLWTTEDESLDKTKKYKFNQPIQTLLSHNGETLIVFKTGSVHPLNDILEDRKTFTPPMVIEESDIYDVIYASLDDDLYFGVLMKLEGEFTLYWTVFTVHYSKNPFLKISLSADNASLKGYAFYTHGKKVSLLTVWNDGKIFSKLLVPHDSESSIGELFSILANISAQHPVKILPLDDKYIAIYGSDPNEEGAVLLIFNTQFKITQSKQIHKLYSDEARLWRMYDFILLPVGQNLFVVPFCLESEQLAALIGSHKNAQSKIDSDISFVTEVEVVNWGENTKKPKKGKKPSADLKTKLGELLKEGLPEAAITEQLLPEILEDGKVKLLEDSLNFFTDIPEALIAQILQFILSCDRKNFTDDPSKEYSNLPEDLMPFERVLILDKVLTRQFSDVLLLPHLRANLSVDQAALLLQYLAYQLSDDGHDLAPLNALKSERCLINWISLVIDSNYQKFVLSKDEKIEDVLVQCRKIVLEHLDTINNLKAVAPILTRLEAEAKGKSYANGNFANSLYSIEQIDY